MPALEAMNLGRPVVASAATGLPEVVADGGVLVDPDDEQAWARVMVDLLTNETRRNQLSAAARARASTFSWMTTVGELVGLYLRLTSVAGQEPDHR
jgi:glycosyltransferase involved in cell wall biosynthesis